MNFYYYLKDTFSKGLLYGPDEEIKQELDRMESFFPVSALPCIMLGIGLIYNKLQITFTINVILLLIKTGLFIGYFKHLYSGKDNKKSRYIALIPEISFDVMIFINEILKLCDCKNKNHN